MFDKPKKPPDEFDVWFALNDVVFLARSENVKLLVVGKCGSDVLLSFPCAANAENVKLLLVENSGSDGLVRSAKLAPVLLFEKPNAVEEAKFFSNAFSTGVDVCVGSCKCGESSAVTGVKVVDVGNLNVKPADWFVLFDVFVSVLGTFPLNVFVVGAFTLDWNDAESNNGFDSCVLSANKIIQLRNVRFRKFDYNFYLPWLAVVTGFENENVVFAGAI